MAKKSNKKTEAPAESTLDIIQQGLAKLWNNHSGEIRDILDEAEDKALTVNFAVNLDESATSPKVKVGIRFSKAITDNVQYTLDDPAQGTFTEIVSEVQEAKVKGEDEEAQTESEASTEAATKEEANAGKE